MHFLANATYPAIGKFVSILGSETQVNSGSGGWMPELRGVLTVIIAVTVLMGSVYLVLATNMGARLGFLVSVTGLAGWFFVMGAIWWTYGIGLKGPDPSWESMPGRTVIQDVSSLNVAGALKAPIQIPEGATPAEAATAVQQQFVAEGWEQLASSAASFGQTSSAADAYLKSANAFPDSLPDGSSAFKVVNVFDIGGERYPTFADSKVDFLAFWHKPRYVVVEVAPVVEQRAEPGRAPATPRIDNAQPHQYVYMIRDMGARRQPAGFITVGSFFVFAILCWLLHRRDRRVAINRGQLALPAQA